MATRPPAKIALEPSLWEPSRLQRAVDVVIGARKRKRRAPERTPTLGKRGLPGPLPLPRVRRVPLQEVAGPQRIGGVEQELAEAGQVGGTSDLGQDRRAPLHG